MAGGRGRRGGGPRNSGRDRSGPPGSLARSRGATSGVPRGPGGAATMRASWYTALADPGDDDDHAPSGRVDHAPSGRVDQCQDLPDTNSVAAALDAAVRAQVIGREAIFERVVREPSAADLAIENAWARLGQRCLIRHVL